MGSGALLTTAQIVGITGEEQPLTQEDVRFVIERAYTPWQAALMLRGPRTAWGREHVRPPHGGGAGHHGEVWLSYGCDGRGIHARIESGGQTRAGFVGWHDAEQLIRQASTPAAEEALHAAVDAHRAHLARRPEPKPGSRGAPCPAEDAAEGGRLLRAETSAWRALIRAGTPEQLDLFREVA